MWKTVGYLRQGLWTVMMIILTSSCGEAPDREREILKQESSPRTAPIERPSKVIEVDENRIQIEKLLKGQAQKDWPNDFVTQEYWVSQQLKDYEFMRSIPNDALKAEVERDFPLDFTTQKYWYSEQVRAKNRMSN